MDLYLSKIPMEKKKLILLAHTSLFLAAKFEEIYYPSPETFLIASQEYMSNEDTI